MSLDRIDSLEYELFSKGYFIVPDFISSTICLSLLEEIQKYGLTHLIPRVHRPLKTRSLDYRVIDGINIQNYLPSVQQIERTIYYLLEKSFKQRFSLLNNPQVAININITSPGGEYRWHYDRNTLTAILYLNTIEAGETEIYPFSRWSLDKLSRFSPIQKVLDSLSSYYQMIFRRPVQISPEPGKLLFILGNKCLHSVRPLSGQENRTNIIFAYQEVNSAIPSLEPLDQYLYSATVTEDVDPNYL